MRKIGGDNQMYGLRKLRVRDYLKNIALHGTVPSLTYLNGSLMIIDNIGKT